MKTKSLKNSFLWDLTNLFSQQILKFIFSIVLARLLSPADFGVVGIAMVYISISNMLVGFGLSDSIINKKNPTQEHLSTIFFLNICVGFLFCVISYFSAPLIAVFFRNELVEVVLKYLSIIIFIKSFSIVQHSLFFKKIDFKSISISHIFVSAISAIIGCLMAYFGYGVWSLVVMAITSELLFALFLWFYSVWRPSFQFNLNSVKSYILYGKDIFISNSAVVLSEKLDTILIGKFFNAATLGFYSRSRSFQVLINNFTGRSLGKVSFPIFSAETNKKKSELLFYKLQKMVIIVILLMIGVLHLISEELFLFLFTEKWEASIPIFKILIISSFYKPLNALFKSFIKGTIGSKLLLKTDIIKQSLLLLVFIPLFYNNLQLFLIFFFIHHLLSVFYNFYLINKFTSINVSALVVCFLKSIFIVIISYLLVKLISIKFNSYLLIILFNSILFLTSYVVFLYIFAKDDFALIKGQINSLINFKNEKK